MAAKKNKKKMGSLIKNIREGMFALSDVTKMDGAGMAADKIKKRMKGKGFSPLSKRRRTQ